MNILITGAGGFIGQNVVKQLSQDKNLNLRLLLMEQEKTVAEQFPATEAIIGTLQEDDTIKKAVAKIDIIIHLASKNIDFDGQGFQEINVNGTARLCAAAAKANVGKIIYLSTVGVYGHAKHSEVDETTPLQPDSDFSRSKAAAEKIILDYHEQKKMSAVILRHRFVYGRGDRHVIKRMIKAARTYPFLISKGRARVSFIHVDDLAAIIKHLLSHEITSPDQPVYHVTDGFPVRYCDLINLFCDTYGFARPKFSIPFLLLYLPVRLKELLLKIDPEVTKSSISSMRLKLVGLDNCFSNKKISDLLPDFKFTKFQDAFPELAEYYQED